MDMLGRFTIYDRMLELERHEFKRRRIYEEMMTKLGYDPISFAANARELIQVATDILEPGDAAERIDNPIVY